MTGRITFIEVEPEGPCSHCGRVKLKEYEKFYKIFVGDNETEYVVCELCRVGFLTFLIEGPRKTYATHLAFYVRNSLLELEEKLPEAITTELNSAMENYENGEYQASFRSIGFVAEWLTKKLFTRKFGELSIEEKLSWEDMLGRLLHSARKEKKTPEEALMYQMFSLKWFRNVAGHPSEYEVSGEDARLGLISIAYLLHRVCSHNLI